MDLRAVEYPADGEAEKAAAEPMRREARANFIVAEYYLIDNRVYYGITRLDSFEQWLLLWQTATTIFFVNHRALLSTRSLAFPFFLLVSSIFRTLKKTEELRS